MIENTAYFEVKVVLNAKLLVCSRHARIHMDLKI